MIDRAKILEELREIAKERGGHCLANEYINSTSKLLFKCKHGHQFESCRDYIKAGNWCPFCAGRGRTIADLQELAAQYGGRCLSPVFLGMGKKHLWECAEGHKWEAIPQNIKTLGRWCPDCGRAKSDRNRRRYTIEDMENLAQLRGGLCLSSHFESVELRKAIQHLLLFIVAGVINAIANVLHLPPYCLYDSSARTKAIALSQLTV